MRKGNSKNRKVPKKLLVLSVGLSATIVLGLIAYKTFFQTQETKFSLKAAIIDQLCEHFPNATFTQRATNLLEEAGFSVSYYESKTANVTFYKELAENGYGIIILRVHSALRANETIVDLFTSEPYDENKYLEERRNGLLTKGEYLFEQQSGRFYFAITPKFIENLAGGFPKSVIIAMGCWSLKTECHEMAQSFINKGAKAYIGWTEIVLPNDTDHETARLLEMLLVQNETLESAVAFLALTGSHTYHDPDKNITVTSRMEFYPLSERNLKISDLIAEAKTYHTTSALYNLGSVVAAIIISESLNRRIFPQRNKLTRQFFVTF